MCHPGRQVRQPMTATTGENARPNVQRLATPLASTADEPQPIRWSCTRLPGRSNPERLPDVARPVPETNPPPPAANPNDGREPLAGRDDERARLPTGLNGDSLLDFLDELPNEFHDSLRGQNQPPTADHVGRLGRFLPIVQPYAYFLFLRRSARFSNLPIRDDNGKKAP